jgi:hypothetical protein
MLHNVVEASRLERLRIQAAAEGSPELPNGQNQVIPENETTRKIHPSLEISSSACNKTGNSS